MSNIPEEYLGLRTSEDFGFSAVDELELSQVTNEETLETQVFRENVSASSEGIVRLEGKMDQILNLYSEGKLSLDADRVTLTADTAGKLSELEQLIVPLLVNLMKNPDKEYLYWPDRTLRVQEQMDRILAITRPAS